MTIPAPSTITLPADLAERLERLPHEPAYLEPMDIVAVLAMSDCHTRADVDFVKSAAWDCLVYAGQLAALKRHEESG